MVLLLLFCVVADAPASGALVGVYAGVRGAGAAVLPLELAHALLGHGAGTGPPSLQALLLRHPVQGRVRQEHLRPARPHLRGLLQSLQRTTVALAMQVTCTTPYC